MTFNVYFYSKEESNQFQTVDTDFSPGDRFSGSNPNGPALRFQTVDTDFSPGDMGSKAQTYMRPFVSDR